MGKDSTPPTRGRGCASTDGAASRFVHVNDHTEIFGIEFVVCGMLQQLAKESTDVLEHVTMTGRNCR